MISDIFYSFFGFVIICRCVQVLTSHPSCASGHGDHGNSSSMAVLTRKSHKFNLKTTCQLSCASFKCRKATLAPKWLQLLAGASLGWKSPRMQIWAAVKQGVWIACPRGGNQAIAKKQWLTFFLDSFVLQGAKFSNTISATSALDHLEWKLLRWPRHHRCRTTNHILDHPSQGLPAK